MVLERLEPALGFGIDLFTGTCWKGTHERKRSSCGLNEFAEVLF